MASPDHLQLDVTVISAKHLKNVNWRSGDLKPYATFYLDPDHRLSTRPDCSGSDRPVWNEPFTIPITRPIHDSLLSLDIFHSRPSETPKPLVGSLQFHLSKLTDSASPIHVLELRRPSGRPQGKVRLKLAVRERPCTPPPPPDYHIAPQSSYYYTPTLPHARNFRDYSSPPYSSEYYYSVPPPPLPSLPFVNRTSKSSAPADPSAPVEFPSSDDQNRQHAPKAYDYGRPTGPSAPVDYSPYDQKPPRCGGLEEGMKRDDSR